MAKKVEDNIVVTLAKGAVKLAKAERSAEKTFAAKQVSALTGFAELLKAHQPINSERWKKFYAKPMRAEFERSGIYDVDSLSPMLNRYQVAAIGLTNGQKAEDGESMKAYVVRIKETLQAAGFYGPQNKGNAKGGKREKANKTEAEAEASEISAEAAALVVAGGDKADAQLLLSVFADETTLKAFRAWAAKKVKAE
jgi:putative intracellular protease/amidase